MIGIDVQPLFGPRTGVYRYLQTLLDELLKIDTRATIRLFAFLRDCRLPSEHPWTGYDLRCIKSFPGGLYRKLLQAGVAFPLDFGCDSYFFPSFVGYPVRRGRTAITVHDLSYLKFPQFVEARNLTYLRMALPRALERADRIVAVSNATASDIDDFFGLGEKVFVVPNAPNEIFHPVGEAEAVDAISPYQLGRPFVLCVGTIEPRKNFDGAIRAFARLPTDMIESLDLVIAGPRGWRGDSFDEALRECAVRDHVHVLGRVSDRALRALYNRALAFIFPSHHEGFGLPILEAMACGCPVLASDVSAIREVTSNAAILVPPGGEQALTAGIDRVVRDDRLRTELRALGHERVKRFQPAASAGRLLEVLQAA